MRSLILILSMGSVLLYSHTGYAGKVNTDRAGEQLKNHKVQVVSSPEVAELASKLVLQYNQTSQGKMATASIAGDETTDGAVYILTSSSQGCGANEISRKIVIGHEIVVPVMNIRNPMLEKLKSEGLKCSDFSGLLAANPGWNKVKPDAGDVPLDVYIVDDPLLVSKLAGFCEMEESLIAAERVISAEELLMTVRNNIHAVGFCKLTDILNAERNGFAEQICILPIDKNQNGRLDRFENIYSTPGEFTRGVWIGKYPSKLCCEIYAASSTADFDEASVDFVEWVINDGQETVSALGYNSLLTREKTAGMLALRPVPDSDYTTTVPYKSNIWVWIFGAAAFVILIAAIVIARLKRGHGIQSDDIEVTPALNAESIMAPAGLFYDKSHTWSFMEQNGLVKIGIDDFLQHITGTLSQVKLKDPGEKVRKGEKIMTIIQKGKKLDIYSPVTGYIKSRNQTLLINPSHINSDPYNSGWAYQIEPSNWLRETKFMFMADKFKEWLDDEFVRLKDFLAASANSNAVVYNHIVLQDGGELTDNVLSDLGPEVWEDFQTHFIDVSR